MSDVYDVSSMINSQLAKQRITDRLTLWSGKILSGKF